MRKALSLDDVLIVPKFSNIESRRNVDISSTIGKLKLSIPIISSNMDSVTGTLLATKMYDNGAIGALHRFQSIEDNVHQYLSVRNNNAHAMVSFGLGREELKRAETLYVAGADHFILDVAHGATMETVRQVKAFREVLGHTPQLIVGNFASLSSFNDFLYHLGNKGAIDALKLSVGSGSACTTRTVTGCGLPTFETLNQFSLSEHFYPIILDGGIKTSGDMAKALAAGASAVMMGRIFAQTEESPGEVISAHNTTWENEQRLRAHGITEGRWKWYRGSASAESYEAQGKTSSWRTAEGDAYFVPVTGTVANVLQQYSAGVKSAFSYVGAQSLGDFWEKAEFVEITSAGHSESFAHGRL